MCFLCGVVRRDGNEGECQSIEEGGASHGEVQTRPDARRREMGTGRGLGEHAMSLGSTAREIRESSKHEGFMCAFA